MKKAEAKAIAERIIRAQETVPGKWHLAADDGHPAGAHLWALDRALAEHLADTIQPIIAAALVKASEPPA